MYVFTQMWWDAARFSCFCKRIHMSAAKCEESLLPHMQAFFVADDSKLPSECLTIFSTRSPVLVTDMLEYIPSNIPRVTPTRKCHGQQYAAKVSRSVTLAILARDNVNHCTSDARECQVPGGELSLCRMPWNVSMKCGSWSRAVGTRSHIGSVVPSVPSGTGGRNVRPWKWRELSGEGQVHPVLRISWLLMSMELFSRSSWKLSTIRLAKWRLVSSRSSGTGIIILILPFSVGFSQRAKGCLVGRFVTGANLGLPLKHFLGAAFKYWITHEGSYISFTYKFQSNFEVLAWGSHV